MYYETNRILMFYWKLFKKEALIYLVKLQQRGFSLLGFTLMFLLVVGLLSFTASTTVHAGSTLKGVALKSPTNIYQGTSKNSEVIKDYKQGTILLYEAYNSSWYSATVYANGGWQNGFINKSDVETSVNDQVNLKGVALKDRTVVYSDASTQSDNLKSYQQGTILIYQTFTSDWYQATVYVSGKRRTGYIHKSHVENAVKDQTGIYGIGLKNPTIVYSDATTKSSNLKSYPIGAKLYYQTFSSEWFQATVYVNGERKTGYIKKSHVEAAAQEDTSYNGVALKGKTHIYKEASTDGGIWKDYGSGSILKYDSFTENWYQATIYADGGWRTGYIRHSDVENAVKDQTNLKGIGVPNPTTVYSEASTGSKALKSYPSGSILNYQTFTSDWYQATVYLNGKPTTGYIHTDDTEELYDTYKSLKGLSRQSPTHIYSKASKSSSVLKSYPRNQILKFETFSPNWYRATVYINGNRTTGYIYRKDVSTDNVVIDTTRYNYNFNSVVDTQMKHSPQVWKSGGFIDASKEQVKYYVNSSNFDQNSASYFQFLDLTSPTGINPTEVNSKVLNGVGKLSGQAQAFIDAGRKYNVNEIYLMAHALHETGNGTSDLSSGIPVDKDGNIVNPKQAVHTVYNMYGYGATDGCPNKCGAKYAFDRSWFTPEDAIIGGAKNIANKYINDGQNTLYKMRWNPDKPGSHQYATDVGWANSQTNRISEIYGFINDYVLIFELPKYNNQPSSSGNPYAYKDVRRTLKNVEPKITKEPEADADSKSTTEPKEDTDSTLITEPESASDPKSTDEPKSDAEAKPAPEPKPDVDSKLENVNTYPDGIYGVTDTGNDQLSIRETPNGEDIGDIPTGSRIEISGKSSVSNEIWYKVSYDGITGWSNGSYIELLNLIESVSDGHDLNVRTAPDSTNDNIIGKVSNGEQLTGLLDKNNKLIRKAEWYQVNFNGEKAWISGGDNGTEYLKVIK